MKNMLTNKEIYEKIKEFENENIDKSKTKKLRFYEFSDF